MNWPFFSNQNEAFALSWIFIQIKAKSGEKAEFIPINEQFEPIFNAEMDEKAHSVNTSE